MYRIAKFLLDHGFRVYKTYRASVVSYRQFDKDGFFGHEVTVYYSKKTWEFDVSLPFRITVPKNGVRDESVIERQVDGLRQEILRVWEFNEEMKRIEDPWETDEG